MSSADLSYYRERAKIERERARSSSSEDIAEIHEELARLYDTLVAHESLRPTLHIVSSKTPNLSGPLGDLISGTTKSCTRMTSSTASKQEGRPQQA